MKIALLSDCYLPRLGGIEVQVHEVATRLAERGHQVEVFTATPSSDSASGTVEYAGPIAIHRLGLRLPFDLLANPFAARAVRDRLRSGGFDVAHVHMGVVSPFAVDAARVCDRLDLPTAMTWHCVLDRFANVVKGLGVVRGWASRGMAMSAVSDIAAEPVRGILVGLGNVDAARARVAVVPNGIDLAQWGPLARAERRAGDPLRIVTAMRLARRKRPVPLMGLLARVRQLVPGDQQLLVDVFGDGPDRRAVERYLAEHGMTSWVTLVGRVPRSDLRARYAAADIYVSPARLESFGIAALEARTVGLPVVSFVGSGVGEFVTDGVNGALAHDDDDFAARLADLVVDGTRREAMRAHNEGTPPTQAWPSVLDALEAEYHRAIESRVR